MSEEMLNDIYNKEDNKGCAAGYDGVDRDSRAGQARSSDCAGCARRDYSFLQDPRIQNVTAFAARYGIYASVVDYFADENRSGSGYYITAGVDGFPADRAGEGFNPYEEEKKHLRNRTLYFPRVFSRIITRENLVMVVDAFNAYCQHTEVIRALYSQYGCALPEVMSSGESSNLSDLNREANNPKRIWSLRRAYEQEIERFFQNEKKIEKSAGHRAYMAYVRSDLCDATKVRKGKDLAYFRMRGKQEIPLELLLNTGAEIVSASVTEGCFQSMKRRLKEKPYVTYSVGELEKYDFGRIEDPDDPWKDEQRYFEYRKFYFKAVDEPEVAGAYLLTKYGGRYPHNENISRDVVRYGEPPKPWPASVARYISIRSLECFLRRAERIGLVCTIDYHGLLLEPTFTKIPIMVLGEREEKLDRLIREMDIDSFDQHFTWESNLPYLKRIEDIS